jgi:O-antigen/teichoic acid export membrane protein
VRSTVVMLAALAGGGLSLAATQRVAELRDRDPFAGGRTVRFLSSAALAAGTVVFLGCWVFAGPLATWLSGGPELEPALRVGALLLIVTPLGGVLSGALAGLEAFRAVARLTLLEAVCGLVLIPTGAWLAGVSGAVGGSVVAALAALPLKQSAVGRRLSGAGIAVAWRPTSAEWSALRQVALPALLLGFSAQPFEWLVRVMLAHRPDGLAQLGLFAAAFSWGNAVLFLPSQVSGPALPIIAHTAAAGDRAGLGSLLRSLLLTITGVAAVVALPLVLLARPIMAAYGRGFSDGAPVLVVILVAYCIASFSGLFRSILTATGRMWWQLLHSVIWGGTLLVASRVFSADGAWGLALSYLVAFGVVVVTQGMSVREVWGRAGRLEGSAQA